MPQSTRGVSLVSRQKRREKAQAAAMVELDLLAESKRNRSETLRNLRLEKTKADARKFKSWRDGLKRSNKT